MDHPRTRPGDSTWPVVAKFALEVLGGPGALIGAATAAYDRAGIPSHGPAASYARIWRFPGTPSAAGWKPPGITCRAHLSMPATHAATRIYRTARSRCMFAAISMPCRTPNLAIVGSRNARRPRGSRQRLRLCPAFAERGLGITSGLAEGIDTCAHRGALRGQGITLGVLGTGIDVRSIRGATPRSTKKCSGRGHSSANFPSGTPPPARQFSATQSPYRGA